MVIFFKVILKDLFLLGKNYPYPQLDCCPKCGSSRLWGHGYVPAYFDGYSHPLWLKRYRCPDGGCIIRLRPEGYFKRFQAAIDVIRLSIATKTEKNKWLSGIERNRQRHWFNALKKRIKGYLTNAWEGGIIAGFDRLMALGQIPVSRGI